MISKDKQYRTRGGQEVRIYATDGGSMGFTIHGAVNESIGWVQFNWTSDGKSHLPSYELVEVKPRHKRTVWLNVYPVGVYTWDTKEQADWSPAPERIACIKVDLDFQEGDGL